MDEQKIRASILKAVTEEVDGWLAEEKSITDPMEYEKRLFERTLRMGRTMLTESRGELSQDRNKKKGLLRFLASLI